MKNKMLLVPSPVVRLHYKGNKRNVLHCGSAVEVCNAKMR